MFSLATRRVLLTMACAVPAVCADPFYLGTWKITTATAAPWAEPGNKAGHKPYEPERKMLVGKTVIFRPDAIVGPRQVGCKGPKYVVQDYPADMLYQGAFGEMQRADETVDPVKMAEKVGFHGKSWKTVETGCEVEIDWHYIDSTTTTFALNNYVYTLKKQ
ncbi:MAG: hypothetical protein ABI823_12410 [Bryobacteraceae bacterium]